MLQRRPPDRRQAAPRRERDRRHRRRLARGVATAVVEYDHEVIGFLVKTEWLAESETFDRRPLARAAVLFCMLFSARPEADCEHFTRLNFADGHEVEELRGRAR